MEQEENFVSRTHSSQSALTLCVRHLNGFVCGFRGILMRRTLFLLCSYLVPSKIIKGEGLVEAEVGASTKQVTFVSLGPSVVVLCLPW